MKKFFAAIITGVMLLSAFGCSTLIKEPDKNTVDYSSCFNGINGCAVFYDYNSGIYSLYNEEQCNTRYSPNSTFKIIATLEGLKYDVVTSENSTMNYNGSTYPFESWNRNLNLMEAFQNSCVWYYRQLIDGVGQKNMAADLDTLGYGNCDVSQWKGSGAGPTEDTNGFWLGSSLEISPIEMVNVIADIFEGKTEYDKGDIDILKNIMASDNIGVYGKTGTGRDNSAWYSGFYEHENNKVYFSVHLENGNGKNIAGADAKAVACDIIDKYYK